MVCFIGDKVMKVEIKGDKLLIEIPIAPHSSKSGKTTVIATSGGNQPTSCQYKDKIVIVGANAYIK